MLSFIFIFYFLEKRGDDAMKEEKATVQTKKQPQQVVDIGVMKEHVNIVFIGHVG